MPRQALNYRARSTGGIEPIATIAAWIVAAALAGWAISIALDVWGQSVVSKQPPWKPFAIDDSTSPRVAAAPATAPAASGTLTFVGVADDRAYLKSGARTLSVAEGDTLPGGEKVKRITRDSMVLMTAAGGETTLALYKAYVPKTVGGLKTSAALPQASASSATLPANDATQACRLSAADRSNAMWIEPAVATALAGESKAFARMFTIVDPARGGLRAQATGGTTAMFAIADGDVLLRADGQPLRTGEAVATDIIGKLQRGDAVVVEGERAGSPRRWVFAPSKCRG